MAPRGPTRTLLESPLHEVLGRVPLDVLRKAGLARCAGCDFAAFETVADAVRELGLDSQRVAKCLAAASPKRRRR